MSNAVLSLTNYPGVSWDSTRSPLWSTTVKSSVSGREVRSANMSYPLWQYKVGFEVLRARTAFPEMQLLAGFYNARNAGADTFLFDDRDDNTATAQGFGTGDGVTRIFQLVRAFGGFTEPVFDLNSAPVIKVGAATMVPGTDYTVTMLQGAGVVTFAVAPGAGSALTWSGTYYWRSRFLKDNLDFSQFMRQLWALRALEFITVKP